MKNRYFQTCCRRWAVGTQEIIFQPIPTLLLAQQSEIKRRVLDQIFKTVCSFHPWFIQIPEASLHFSDGAESRAAERGHARCARDASSPGIAHACGAGR